MYVIKVIKLVTLSDRVDRAQLDQYYVVLTFATC